MATREEMADWSLSELLDRIAELEAEPARLQEILLKQTKLNTRVIKEKMELKATIKRVEALITKDMNDVVQMRHLVNALEQKGE